MTLDGAVVNAYLRPLQAAATENVDWPGGLSFRVRTFLTAQPPPFAFVTSSRALVLRDGDVLVMSDRAPSTHVLPGGRIQPGEDPKDAAVREVAEESGWEVVTGAQIGVRHFRHLQARPEGYVYLYPDFFQVVYVARAVACRPELREPDGWETEGRFMPARGVQELSLSAGERVLLAAALQTQARQPSTRLLYETGLHT